MSRPPQNFYTADTHFGHANIIKPGYDNRPWPDIESHDGGMLQNFISTLQSGDTLYHLGDVAWNQQSGDVFFNAMKRHGVRVVWIKGNHDDRCPHACCQHVHDTLWKSVKGAPAGGLWLSHYPHRSWPGSYHGSGHLFGHVHGKLNNQYNGRALDVGVMNWFYHPVSQDQILAALDELGDIKHDV